MQNLPDGKIVAQVFMRHACPRRADRTICARFYPDSRHFEEKIVTGVTGHHVIVVLKGLTRPFLRALSTENAETVICDIGTEAVSAFNPVLCVLHPCMG